MTSFDVSAAPKGAIETKGVAVMWLMLIESAAADRRTTRDGIKGELTK